MFGAEETIFLMVSPIVPKKEMEERFSGP